MRKEKPPVEGRKRIKIGVKRKCVSVLSENNKARTAGNSPDLEENCS